MTAFPHARRRRRKLPGSATPRIESIEGPPVIGSFYMVPCVFCSISQMCGGEKKWWPVLGPRHNDLEYIGIKGEHYHHDLRFTSPDAFGNDEVRPVDLGRLLHANDGPVYRRIRCNREMPTFPLSISGKRISFIGKLERAYADKRLNLSCMTCPHKGFPLKGMPVKDGVVVCPGHGLAWNVFTGELHRRTGGGR